MISCDVVLYRVMLCCGEISHVESMKKQSDMVYETAKVSQERKTGTTLWGRMDATQRDVT